MLMLPSYITTDTGIAYLVINGSPNHVFIAYVNELGLYYPLVAIDPVDALTKMNQRLKTTHQLKELLNVETGIDERTHTI